MKTGIVVYSQTGNTLFVAQKIKEELVASGLMPGLEQVTVIGEVSPGAKNVKLNNIPDVGKYDLIIFGAPVQAFSLTPAMTAYLQQLSSLENKKVICFVTKQLPFYWTGGNQAVGRMKQLCENKGAAVLLTEIVVWSKSGREKSIDDCVNNIANHVKNNYI